MAKKRRKAIRRKRKLKFKLASWPTWSLLVLGLAVGIALTVLLQLLVHRTNAPGSGLNTLFSSSEKPRRATEKAPTAEAPAAKIPKYDFYTILPEIETVLPEKESTATSRPAGAAPTANVSYVLQAASFARFEDADRLKAKLTLNGLVAHIQKVVIEGKGEYHRVRLGPYSNLNELDAADQRLRALGIHGLRLKLKREG
jgi:cell division protein FtsN